MFKRLSRTPLTEEVIELLKEKITSNSIPVGERLPTESQLVEELGVSRSTIREVLITLQAEGFIKIKRGIGAFVIDKEEFDRQKFIEWFNNNEFEIQELLEIRRAIEPYVTLLATKKITNEELKKLENNFHYFQKCVKQGNVDEIVKMDEEFHFIILKAARNQGLKFMYSNFIPRLHEYRKVVFSSPFDPNLAVKAHENILAAIKNNDAEQAQQQMLNHIIESENDVTETVHKIKRNKSKRLD